MPRAAVLALAVAAVLGTTAGALAAVSRSDPLHPFGSGSSHGAPHLPTTNDPLLYATNHRIADGSHVISYHGPGNVEKLVRIRGGYLIADRRRAQLPDFDLWAVTRAGKASLVASITGPWDVDATGTRLTAFDTATRTTEVWSLPDGDVTARWNRDNGNPTTAAFTGDDVAVSQRSGDRFALLRWDPSTGTTEPIGTGYSQARVSPDGRYVTGGVDASGSSTRPAGRCMQTRATDPEDSTPLSWRSCHWRGYLGRPLFSPDSKRMLVVPVGTRTRQVKTFGILDVTAGPDKPAGQFDVPSGTLSATWDDNDHLFVVGSNTGSTGSARSGTRIDRCTLKGHCERVATLDEVVTLASTS